MGHRLCPCFLLLLRLLLTLALISNPQSSCLSVPVSRCPCFPHSASESSFRKHFCLLITCPSSFSLYSHFTFPAYTVCTWWSNHHTTESLLWSNNFNISTIIKIQKYKHGTLCYFIPIKHPFLLY